MTFKWTLLAIAVAGALALAAPAAWAVTPDGVAVAIAALDSSAQQAVDTGEVPGLAIAVVWKDKVVFLKGYGRREAGRGEAVDADTVFQIASLSKPVSATVVAALVGAGVVRWDSRIAELDPGFRLADAWPTDALTLTDLFDHRSGLPGAAGNELESLGFSRGEILRRLRFVPPASSFRSAYSYSNFGLTEGAVAAARPTGEAWEQVAEERLYRPLGMTSTSSLYADFLARPDRASQHVRVGGAWKALTTRDPDAQAPAGGVSSSARDLAQWVRLELGDGEIGGRRLIAAQAIEATHAPLMWRGPNPVTGAASFYGLGWNVEYGRHGLSWGHAGAFSTGARTLVTIYPEAQLGVVVLTNAFPTGVPEGLVDRFADQAFDGRSDVDWVKRWNTLYGQIFGPDDVAARARFAHPPAQARAAAPLAAYVGRYASDYLGEARVEAGDGGLVLRMGPDGAARFPLTHFDGDVFLCHPSPETPDVPSAVRFTLGADGKAEGVTVDAMNDAGMGTLKRAGP
jgi:CubicO group peptidase (beta-lactamase class C family)